MAQILAQNAELPHGWAARPELDNLGVAHPRKAAWLSGL
jgi:hypothetical protein